MNLQVFEKFFEVKRIKLQWYLEVTSKITKNHLFAIFIANNAK